jgi:hypothetical protein
MGGKTWLRNYTAELDRAEEARRSGNEGMARVCARRAVGWLLGEYFSRREIHFQNPSAYERLKFLIELDGVPDDIKQVAGHFTIRITPDHALPIDADLIQEARWLREKLLDAEEG